MTEKNSWLTILVIVALISSVAAIYISLSGNSGNGSNYVTREEFNQEHALLSTALQESDYQNFRTDLDEYNSCIRRAVSAYANCDQATEQPESFNICYNNLNANMVECVNP